MSGRQLVGAVIRAVVKEFACSGEGPGLKTQFRAFMHKNPSNISITCDKKHVSAFSPTALVYGKKIYDPVV